MKKIALVIGFLIPVLSFASNIPSNQATDNFLEQCAKEKDPVKRQNSCHMLDHHSTSQINIPEFHKEIVTV
ncbi:MULTISPECIES: hypothetical protein [Legionella]|uniref:Uncharacterized protein n=1 Tax=Legionella drozanskii LLAP-1 TaxID=1212489 RepID=A0A0W0SVF2_9GAMM|nr:MULTISPECIES: hypothetical protein [Legionella]KTC87366.1 hypothetical protein Ldro_0985 [Legionella drozanskii LLAP-1]PJE08424.1 MAG: hypothetical protein CK430_12430 [Legionella sp.]